MCVKANTDEVIRSNWLLIYRVRFLHGLWVIAQREEIYIWSSCPGLSEQHRVANGFRHHTTSKPLLHVESWNIQLRLICDSRTQTERYSLGVASNLEYTTYMQSWHLDHIQLACFLLITCFTFTVLHLLPILFLEVGGKLIYSIC